MAGMELSSCRACYFVISISLQTPTSFRDFSQCWKGLKSSSSSTYSLLLSTLEVCHPSKHPITPTLCPSPQDGDYYRVSNLRLHLTTNGSSFSGRHFSSLLRFHACPG